MDVLATADIIAQFERSAGVAIVPDDTLEVSLDCPGCGRIGRTIIVHQDRDTAICTPTRHPVAARILTRDCLVDDRSVEVRYRIVYPTGTFSDPKRHTPSVPHPTWARITVHLTCSACHAVTKQSTQNNAGRPWPRRCTCGQALLTETVENPQFRLLGPSGEVLYERHVSSYTIWLDPAAPATIIGDLARMLTLDPECITERAPQRQPIFEHHPFATKPPDDDPHWPYQAFRDLAFLLLRAGIAFDIHHDGRSLTPAYAYQLRELGEG